MRRARLVSPLSRVLGGFAAAFLLVLPAIAQSSRLGIGRPATNRDIAGWNIDVSPDGAGLPAGHGSAREGKDVYARVCASCHGDEGKGGTVNPGPRLAGGRGSLATQHPVKTVGSYWPFATTLFDYIRRAMPYNAPESLNADQVYAVTAYVLFLNGIVDADTELNATTLPAIHMPNRDGFRNAYQGEQKGVWR